jgi:mycothiol system anti-sigma-R factor
MSCGDHHDTPCDQVLPNIILYIDQEIFDNNQLNAVEIHFGECLPCKEEMEREHAALTMMRNLLTRSCIEDAPQSLHERLIEQTAQLHQQMAAQEALLNGGFGLSGFVETTYPETTYTEITIDGETQIEITREIRREFPLE